MLLLYAGRGGRCRGEIACLRRMMFASLGVGLVEGGAEIGCDGGDGEDAAAGGDEVAVFDGGAGVEDDDIFGRAVVRGRDGFAGGVFAGVAAAGGDDADAGSGAHLDGELVGGAVDGGVEEVDDVGLEAEEDGLGLGVAEAGVELEDHGAARGHHDAAEEDAFEGCALGASCRRRSFARRCG